VRNNLFVGSDVDFTVTGERERFEFTPWTMRILGGKGAGTLVADFTGAVPAYQVRYAVTQLHVNDLFDSLAPGRAGEGFLDFTADLSMRGFDADDLTRTAEGEASLHGENLELAIGDLDHKLEHYESSQNFNLVDVGAFFIAGPLGTVVTKGYNFATIFQGAQGNTHVRRLLSNWRVEHGIAHAQDVAMATQKNRLVMKGALDFVNREFDEVTVAAVDKKGCALVEQKIVGPFSRPEVKQPNVLVSMMGPVTRLIGKMKKIVGMKCDVI
jgi:AsmA protein